MNDENFFRSHSNKFTMNTSCITDLGRHKCGEELLKHPTVDLHSSVFLCHETNVHHPVTMVSHTPFNKSDEETSKDREKLFILSQRCTESLRSTVHQNSIKVPVTGTLKNTKDHAIASFRGDEHQCKAFELIVAAFIVELHKGPMLLGRKHRQREKVLEELKNVNHAGQFVAFLSGPGGTGKSRVRLSMRFLLRATKLC